MHIEIHEVPYVFINYHAPNDQQSQATIMKEIVEKLKTIPADKATSYIWGGDWNCVLNKYLDALEGVSSLKKESVGQIKALMTDFDLIDIWRVRNPTYRKFTWRRSKPLTLRRLDYFLVSSHMELDTASYGFYTQIQSDHSQVFLKISPLADAYRGPRYWKFNNSLVSDTIYTEKTRELISEIKTNSFDFDDIRVKWEFLKFSIRQFTQSYSKIKAQERRQKRLNLEKKVKILESKISESSDPEVQIQYNNAKNELEDLHDYITDGAILRSKVNWYERGEKSAKYFLNLEKHSKSKTHIRKLIAPESGSEITAFAYIQKEIKHFYQSLYNRWSTMSEQQCIKYLKQINTPKLSDEGKLVCEGKLSVKECRSALQSMSNGKSPGSDGLTREFYVCFWEDIGSCLVSTLNYSFEHGELTSSQKQAVITLIEKRVETRNWLRTGDQSNSSMLTQRFPPNL